MNNLRRVMAPSMKRRRILINKLGRLEKKGFAVNKRLNAYSNVDELRSEVKRITYSIDVEQSVRFLGECSSPV